jgi:hypothetical protein
MRRKVAGLPVIIVGVVRHLVLPKQAFAFERLAQVRS